jgi:hypothetical protein
MTIQPNAMNYNEVKRILIECPALSGLDYVSQGFLLRHGDETIFSAGEIIYGQGTKLDDTFCILLSGSVAIEKGGRVVADTSKSHVFGEMAYFSSLRQRTATVRATSPETSVLRIRLPSENLDSPLFASLKKHFAVQPWTRPVD